MTESDLKFEGLCVLLVEDEPGLQEAFSIILELEGCKVVRANDGKEALVHLSDIHPDVIVTDYMMPRMNGIAMIKYIQANAELADIPILLMSAALPRNLDTDIADVALSKPVSMHKLLEVIEQLTAGKNKQARAGR